MNVEMIDLGGGLRLKACCNGAGPLVLMLHGFPGLGYSWRHQMDPLARAGFHAVALDALGYGGSDRPLAIEHYTSDRQNAYLAAVLDHFGQDRAVIVGQDFGAQYAWNFAVRSSARVRGLVATIPYDYDLAGRALLGAARTVAEDAPVMPDCASPNDPPSARFAEMARHHFVHLHYFQAVGPADRELAADPVRFLANDFWALSARGDLWSWSATQSAGHGYLDALPPAPPLPWDWLSEDEFAQFVTGYDHPDPDRRFIGGLNSYRTADANWEIGRKWADHDVQVPTLFIHGAKDPSFGFFPHWRERLERRAPGLRAVVEIADAGHFLQQEQPQAFNSALLEFLAGLLE
jgi:pimeloyl-ACP methyl ester carboxylesterase